MLRLAIGLRGGGRTRLVRREAPRWASSWASSSLWSEDGWKERGAPAFRTFLEKENHLMIPVKFVVPQDEQWPQGTRGLELGKVARWLRKRRRNGKEVLQIASADLEAMQFPWDWTQYKWEHFVLPMLHRFYDLNGHTDVPRTFVVPKGSSDWPEKFWGEKLGQQVANIRYRGDFLQQVKECAAELEEIEFELDEFEDEWTTSSLWTTEEWQQRGAPAFRAFLEKEQHLMVPGMFVVPSGDDQWPQQTWGLKLGSAAAWLRRCWRGDLEIEEAVRADLEAMGFIWDWNQYRWDDRIMPMLRRYYELHGHSSVEYDFVVPKGSGDWPEKFWGEKLGQRVSSIRSGCFAKQVKASACELQEIGFVWDYSENEWRERIFPALKCFYQHFKHCRVPQSFVVPLNDEWPKASWGLNLGYTVNRIRSKDFYSAQVNRDKAQLHAIGFVWRAEDAKWRERIMPAFEAFHRHYRRCRVSRAFVVPNNSEWPEQSFGLKLGGIVHRIHYHGTHFDYTTRSIDALKSLGFDLKIPVSKWKERVEPLLDTFEQVHGHRNVPLEFVVPSTAPWDERDWGIPLGKLELRR